MNTKEYVCECGKVFTNPQSFNGHKSHCVIHLQQVGRLHIRQQIDATNGLKSGTKLKKYAEQRSINNFNKWLNERHTCEYCGKIMTEKYGSGRFCSKLCSHKGALSTEKRKELAAKIKMTTHAKAKISTTSIFERNYYTNPNYCIVCGKQLDYTVRTRKTCSEECYRSLMSSRGKELAQKYGGNINSQGVRGTARYGTYRGIHCDSSYELAVVIYCLDHNIRITRNQQGFPYIYEDKQHVYYPDFIIEDTYVEVKNFTNNEVVAKQQQFPSELKYKLLYESDIQNCITYCKEYYGKDFTTLYDRNHPSWMDKIKHI